jgi:hypothetical protein
VHRQRDEPTEQVHLPASCTFGALAQLGNDYECMAMRLLRLRGRRARRAGATVVVPMVEIEKQIRLLLEGPELVES